MSIPPPTLSTLTARCTWATFASVSRSAPATLHRSQRLR
jgi:hypothetical protein